MPTSITVAPGRDPIPSDKFRPADGGDQDLGAPALGLELARMGVRDGDGRIRGEQQRRHRLADDRRPPEHERTRAANRNRRRVQQLHHAARRAGRERRQPVREPAHVERMEAVHVLGWVDRLDHRARTDLRR